MARPNLPRQQLHRYLAAHFPGLALAGGLFYRWPHGLRFDLRPAEYVPFAPHYFAQVQERAAAIWEATFAPGDELLVVGQQPRRGRAHLQRRGSLLRLLPRLGPADLGFYQLTGVYGPEYDDPPMLRAVARVRAADVNYRGILAGLARREFSGLKPRLEAEVYFLNLTRGLILHMYDDRGLDLLATAPTALLPVYRQRHDWLLDYDLERMQAHFGPLDAEPGR